MNRFIILLSFTTFFACDDEFKQTIDPKNRSTEDDRANGASSCEFVCYFPPMPTFSGGEKSLREFINSTLKSPEQCIEGRVYIQFIVDENGTISDAKVVKGLCELCDKNALELFSKMPNWIPAKVNPASVKMVLPVIYRLDY